jgi:hypothetical protein
MVENIIYRLIPKFLSEVLWLPHFLYNQLINGGEVVSLTHQSPLTPEDTRYLCRLEAVDPRNMGRLEGLGELKNPVTSSGIELMNLPAMPLSASPRSSSKCLNYFSIWRLLH